MLDPVVHHRSSSYYIKLREGAIVTQCRWRGRVARRELRKLKLVSLGATLLLKLRIDCNSWTVTLWYNNINWVNMKSKISLHRHIGKSCKFFYSFVAIFCIPSYIESYFLIFCIWGLIVVVSYFGMWTLREYEKGGRCCENSEECT